MRGYFCFLHVTHELSPPSLLPATQVEFNVTTGGQLVGKIVVGLFGNTAPKTVQNVSRGGQSGCLNLGE